MGTVVCSIGLCIWDMNHWSNRCYFIKINFPSHFLFFLTRWRTWWNQIAISFLTQLMGIKGTHCWSSENIFPSTLLIGLGTPLQLIQSMATCSSLFLLYECSARPPFTPFRLRFIAYMSELMDIEFSINPPTRLGTSALARLPNGNFFSRPTFFLFFDERSR